MDIADTFYKSYLEFNKKFNETKSIPYKITSYVTNKISNIILNVTCALFTLTGYNIEYPYWNLKGHAIENIYVETNDDIKKLD